MKVRRYLETRETRIIGRTVELRGRRNGGETFPLEMSLSAIDLPEGIGFMGVIRDLTERQRLQGRMIQAEKLASLGLLSAGVAHEINNPLAYVTNNLAVLERDVSGPGRGRWRPMKRPGRPWRRPSRSGRTDRQAHRGARPALRPREPGGDPEEHAAWGQACVRHRAEPARVCPARPGRHRPGGPECGDRQQPGADPGPAGTAPDRGGPESRRDPSNRLRPGPDQPGDPEPSAQRPAGDRGHGTAWVAGSRSALGQTGRR